MDAYHRVLAKLYEVTGGKDTKSVDFKELVRSLGFHGNYPDIFERMSGAGWIAEDQKADFVRITHWGVLEITKTPNSANKVSSDLSGSVKKAAAQTKELNLLLEIFAGDNSKDNLKALENKLSELNDSINRIKSSLDQ